MTPRRRLPRPASPAPLLVIALLLSVLPVSWPGQPAAKDAAAASVASGPPERTYFVEWNITASGYSDIQEYGYRKVSRRNIEIIGEAVHH